MDFPKRIYTKEEVKQARELIDKGYKHETQIDGSTEFITKVGKALDLIATAGYCDFVQTYIRIIKEISGLSQLREEDAAIWFHLKALDDPVNDAGFIIQKTQQMKDFIEGRLYYETAEIRAVNKRLEFVKKLQEQTKDLEIKKKCEENITKWKEQPLP
jgi:hypothetical protein